ncbi:hypothetical protein [Streptomyces hesseae]|uniref:Uncharacterized protein n=1 Tax=Streptomyces hesseae TaxID=3075519 RepID=A0ABU2SFJ5_9ACTN|nr:hypothetical protein [Streptomyces sp. DSM 40473]MDT0447543.1 hypothetical protein [Streptomyces sp. DSM 40473]
MRWMSIALAAVATVGVMSTPAAAAQVDRDSHHRAQLRADPPWPYKDCMDAAVKQRKETADHAKWHCDQLVKKGWIKPPTAEDKAAQSTNPKGTNPKGADPKGTGPKSDHPKGHHPKAGHPEGHHPRGHHAWHGKPKPKR